VNFFYFRLRPEGVETLGMVGLSGLIRLVAQLEVSQILANQFVVVFLLFQNFVFAKVALPFFQIQPVKDLFVLLLPHQVLARGSLLELRVALQLLGVHRFPHLHRVRTVWISAW